MGAYIDGKHENRPPPPRVNRLAGDQLANQERGQYSSMRNKQ